MLLQAAGSAQNQAFAPFAVLTHQCIPVCCAPTMTTPAHHGVPVGSGWAAFPPCAGAPAGGVQLIPCCDGTGPCAGHRVPSAAVAARHFYGRPAPLGVAPYHHCTTAQYHHAAAAINRLPPPPTTTVPLPLPTVTSMYQPSAHQMQHQQQASLYHQQQQQHAAHQSALYHHHAAATAAAAHQMSTGLPQQQHQQLQQQPPPQHVYHQQHLVQRSSGHQVCIIDFAGRLDSEIWISELVILYVLDTGTTTF